MNTHIALYKFKDDVSQADIDTVSIRLALLSDLIPGITSIKCAENTSQYSEGYKFVIIVTGNDQAAIDAYRAHPEHLDISALLDAMEEKSIGVDFQS